MSILFLFTSLSHFHVVHYSQIRSTPTNVTVCLLLQMMMIAFITIQSSLVPLIEGLSNSTRPMSRLQVVFRELFVCDENIYYTITCLFVYPATAFGKFRQDCLHKSDISFGDFASSCGGRLSIGNLYGHTPWVFDWVPRATSSPTA